VAEAIREAAPYSVNPSHKLKILADEFLSVAHLPGDVADLGTCRGGTALLLRRLAPDKYLHLFDTWEGNPYDDPLCHHKRGEWKASLEECKQLVGENALTYYWKGTFCQDLPHCYWKAYAQLPNYCFVYVDMDTYQATKEAIEFFWPRMSPGGKMVFDDWSWLPCAGVKKAVDEFFPHSDIGRVVGNIYIVSK
jgi:hypothetical protein